MARTSPRFNPRADIDGGQTQNSGEGRADGAVAKLALRLVDGRPGNDLVCAEQFQRRFRQDPAFAQLKRAFHRLLLLQKRSFRARQVGAFYIVIEPGDHVALSDIAAGSDEEFDDPTIGKRYDIDGTICPCRADGFNVARHGFQRRFRYFYA